MTIPISGAIDPDILFDDLLRLWRMGNKDKVIEFLANDHPALAALFIVHGCQVSKDRRLGIGDCNEIANRLIDIRVALCQQEIV